MTSDKSRKRDIRRRMQATGEPYAEAARRIAEQDAQPILAADVPPARVPAPVAVMLARHLFAATQHIGRARRLAADHHVPAFAEGDHRRDRPGGPLHEISTDITGDLFGLVDWANRTAHACGAVPAVTTLLGGSDAEQRQAYEILYPDSHTWCASVGGVLPGPGEQPGAQARRTVTHSLPGPVPAERLASRTSGPGTTKAADVVAGTPAGPVWQAGQALERYTSDWMNRGGDSPADLAATLDGLGALAAQLHSAVAAVVAETGRRLHTGSLTGVDLDRLEAARDQAAELLGPLEARIRQTRLALTGATAALPPAAPGTVPPNVAGPLDGKTLAEIRAELGDEVFTQRHIGKTRPTDERRADALERIVQWMHARGDAVYDAPAHAKTDPAARLSG
ncbi:hypothetical protein [Streptosporangium roseum]|uniref:hypothetical protein n=1 Tax=Streptosporangium roseum TaxID=2001 RepID=UPI0034447679